MTTVQSLGQQSLEDPHLDRTHLDPAGADTDTDTVPAAAAAELLRAAALRVTRPRVEVVRSLSHAPHATADAVARDIRARGERVSTQAVYDVLRALIERGLVRVFEPAGHATRYELRAGDNHHHLVCRGCGDVRDVDCATGAAPCLETTDDHGFAIDEAEVTYWGYCPACR